MALNQIFGDMAVSGNFSCGTLKLPTGAVSDASVSAGAAISAPKLVHVISKTYQQNQNAAVVADTQYAHIVNGATCTVYAVNAAVDTVATGADRTVTVDLQRSTAGGAFASILTTPLVLNNANVARTMVSAALATTTLTQKDLLKWVISVAGSAGNQASGLVVEAILYEAAS